MLARRAIAVLLLSVLLCSVRAWSAAPPPTVLDDQMEADFDLRCQVRKSPGPMAPASILLGYNAGAPHLAITLAPDALSLARVTGNKRKVLATATQGYTPPSSAGTPLVVQWRHGNLNVIYDGRTLLRQQNLGAVTGAIATTSAAGVEFAEARAQPVEPVSFADDFMRTAGEKGQWEPVTGDWKVHSAPDPAKVANAFTYGARGKPAIAVAGNWFWDSYTAAAAVRTAGGSEIGLIVYWQDAKNYLLFRWLAEDDESARGHEMQLWRVWRGEPMLLAAAPGGYRARQWYHVAVGAGNGDLAVTVDGQRVLQKHTDLFGQGKVGLYSNGDKETLFDDVVVDHSGDAANLNAAHCEAITPQFTKEESMENWASPKAEWLAAAHSDEPAFWHRGVFYGDQSVELKATALEPNRARVTAVLGGDGESLTSGYALVVTAPADKQHVEAVLLRQGKAVAHPQTARVDAASGCIVRLERAGRVVRAYIGQDLVATCNDANPLPGRRAAYAARGAFVPPGDAKVTSHNLYDYTFYRAPTDWYVSGGTWDMTSRWDCTPTWSWYGGWSDHVAAIWDKHCFSGDCIVEMFAAVKRENGAYQHVHDINITIAGDGRDLASGYSFIFGGWHNTATRLLRGTRTVAETKDVLLPRDYQGQAHHKWFCLRVEKTGDTISCYVDRKLAVQYRDPAPLTGRRLALWTNGNAVMIARATIYYEKELEAEPVPVIIPHEGLRTVATDKLHWTVRGNDPALRLDAVTAENATPPTVAVRALNVEGGGQFAITPALEPFDALKTPRLSFDCQVSNGAAVNLYLKAKGVMHSVQLTGPAKDQEVDGTKSLGPITSVRADGLWHHVTIDLAALLKPLYPNDNEIRVEEMCFGNLTRDTYLQSGFGANYPGTRYLVRAFTVASADNRLVKVIQPEVKSGPVGPGIMAAPPALTIVSAPVPAGTPSALTRGLFNLRATYCQDPEGGAFKPETLNKPIAWDCFQQRIFTKTVDTIDFDWQDKSPGFGVRPKYWSARFSGKLVVPAEADYTFCLDRLDDGARLYIDGKSVIESWLIQPAAAHDSRPVHLAAGVHDLRLDYCQGTGPASVTLRWNGPGFGREVVPKVNGEPGNLMRRVAAAGQ